MVLLAPVPAFATASLDCSADDKSITFDAHSAVSHGLAEAITNFRAELSMKVKGLPDALGRLELDGSTLVHHWLYGKELKLRLYHEAAEGMHGSVEMVIQTRGGGDDGAFGGRYLLSIFQAGKDGAADKTLTFRGKVTCSVG